MKIGALSEETGCNIETIRYYEKIGLLRQPERSEGNYRLYNANHLKQLKFIMKARFLGFSLEQIRSLIKLSEINNLHSCNEVQQISKCHLDLINQKINDLNILKQQLEVLLDYCYNNDRPCCPLIDKLFIG